MPPKEAAKSLHNLLLHKPWFNGVGVGMNNGKPVLYIYVKTKQFMKLPFLGNEWEGYPIIIRETGCFYLV